MGARRDSLAASSSSIDSKSDIERRLAMLENPQKVKNRIDPFAEDFLDPMERVDFEARPIDPNVIRRLAAMGSTDDEIAQAYGVDADHLRNVFAQELNIGRAQGITALRRKQFQLAMKGNVPMLIHLGKHVLGQGEEITHTHKGKIQHEDVTADPRETLLNLLREASERMRSVNPMQEIPVPQIAAGHDEI